MRFESRKYLDDMQRAANVLRGFTAGRSLDQYRNDAMLRAAVYCASLASALRRIGCHLR